MAAQPPQYSANPCTPNRTIPCHIEPSLALSEGRWTSLERHARPRLLGKLQDGGLRRHLETHGRTARNRMCQVPGRADRASRRGSPSVFDMKCPNRSHHHGMGGMGGMGGTVKVKSYETRGTHCEAGGNANERGSAQERGMWWGDVRCATLCKYLSVGLLLGYAPGEVVYDWGLGCGFAVGWLERLFAVRTTGHELSQAAAASAARRTGAANVCWGDGTALAHVPDASVDHVTANAAVYHLRPEAQCALVLEHFLRILRPGGTLWIGWNGSENDDDMHGAPRFMEPEWRRCLRRAGDSIFLELPKEQRFFGDTEYARQQPFSVIVVKRGGAGST